MPPGTLDDQYLPWLYSQVADVRTPRSSDTYWDLFKLLYSTEFVWIVPNDDNRAEDGRELRFEWADRFRISLDPEWSSLCCSFLEMLIALSRRLSFEADGDASDWFWHLLDNLELLGFHDRSGFSNEEVEDKIHAVLWRTYDRNGHGGLFPLQRAKKDQRRVEIWYQLSEYLLQHDRQGGSSVGLLHNAPRREKRRRV